MNVGLSVSSKRWNMSAKDDFQLAQKEESVT
jgi:hypothetical protein